MFDMMVVEDLDAGIAALEGIPAGAELAAALEAITLPRLNAHQRVAIWHAHQRQVAHYQAKGVLDMVAVEDHFLAQGDDEAKASVAPWPSSR